MFVNSKTLDLIKRFEGLRLDAYLDPIGVPTIGFGHSSFAGPPLVRIGMRITEAEALDLLHVDVDRVAERVRRLITVPLNTNQFGALVSLAYNIGVKALGGSTALRLVNERNFEAVPEKIKLWTHAGGKVLNGLVARRQAEVDLWLTPVIQDDAGTLAS